MTTLHEKGHEKGWSDGPCSCLSFDTQVNLSLLSKETPSCFLCAVVKLNVLFCIAESDSSGAEPWGDPTTPEEPLL